MRKTFELNILMCLVILVYMSCKSGGLKLEKDEILKITQRDSKVFKGSDGDVELLVGDITLGKSVIKVKSVHEDKLYMESEMGVGDEAFFKYAERHYYKVRIKNFENHLIHDDIAFLTVTEVTSEEAEDHVQKITSAKQTAINDDEVTAMLEKIRHSGLKFIRNGEIYDDSFMASHLESKYLINQDDIQSKEDFFKRIISTSMTTGEPYKVIVLEDTVLLEDWIRE